MSVKRKAGDAAAAAVSSGAKKAKVNGSITAFFGQPKAVASASGGAEGAAAAAPAPAPAASTFDKAKWVAGLSEEQRELLQLEIDTMDESWLAALRQVVVTKEFLELKRFLQREAAAGQSIYPPREDIYSWYIYTLSLLSLLSLLQPVDD